MVRTYTEAFGVFILNKKPEYELPDKDVLIKSYKRKYSNFYYGS